MFWFGGKSRVAHLVWPRLGDIKNYVEPFAGSLAVLLSRPHWNADDGLWHTEKTLRSETVNDLDGSIVNVWRAIQRDPDAVAEHADNPVFELDLHALHLAINRKLLSVEGLDSEALDYAESKGVLPFAARLTTDPEYYDPIIAGWWIWGVSCWIGDNFARPKCNARPHLAGQGVNRQLPHLVNVGRGVNRKIPNLQNLGKGVNRKLPHLRNAGKGVNRKLAGEGHGTCTRKRDALLAWFAALSDRLRNVDICCGDWERICGPTPTVLRSTPCGVFLDPPYSQDAGLDTVYGDYHDPGLSARVRAWCIERGADRDLRAAICGYEGEGHEALEDAGWTVEHWKASGGYSNQNREGNENRHRERIWFSPHCLATKALF